MDAIVIARRRNAETESFKLESNAMMGIRYAFIWTIHLSIFKGLYLLPIFLCLLLLLLVIRYIQVNGDGCDKNCKIEKCGNGILQTGEQCDDGNMVCVSLSLPPFLYPWISSNVILILIIVVIIILSYPILKASNDGCSSTCQIEVAPQTVPSTSIPVAIPTYSLPPAGSSIITPIPSTGAANNDDNNSDDSSLSPSKSFFSGHIPLLAVLFPAICCCCLFSILGAGLIRRRRRRSREEEEDNKKFDQYSTTPHSPAIGGVRGQYSPFPPSAKGMLFFSSLFLYTLIDTIY